MNTRLLGVALVAVYLLGPQNLASAQHHGHGRGQARGGVVAGGVVGAPVVAAPRIVAGGYPRVIFARPYYAFRPYTQVRSGLFLGFSVPYPARYFYPAGYPYIPYYSSYYYAPPIYPYIPPLTYMSYGSPYGVVI